MFLTELIEALMVKTVETMSDLAVTKNRLEDPVYKKNVQKLIERNRELKEARE
jgi:hypothetical protein